MISRRYRKPHRYKKRKPLLRNKFLIFGFLTFIIVCTIFYGLFLWQIFWVKNIVVSGEQKLAKEAIEVLVAKRSENTILFFNTKSILAVDGAQIKKDILNAFPEISEVRVDKRFFDTIAVQITERTAVARWCADNNCFFVDGQGVIFEPAPPDSALIAIETVQPPDQLFPGEAVVPADKIVQILAVQSKLVDASKIVSKKAILLSEERLDIETTEGWTIRFNLKGDLDWQITELNLTLEKQISPEKRKSLEYIDLRFSRVYYK